MCTKNQIGSTIFVNFKINPSLFFQFYALSTGRKNIGNIPPPPTVLLRVLKAEKSCEERNTRYFDRIHGRIKVMEVIYYIWHSVNWLRRVINWSWVVVVVGTGKYSKHDGKEGGGEIMGGVWLIMCHIGLFQA